MSQRLKKSEVLRGRRSFSEVFTGGHRFEGHVLRCIVLSDLATAEKRISFGIVVSRDVKGAVVRNRIKRLVRESFRKNKKTYYSELLTFPNSLRLVFMLRQRSSAKMSTLLCKDIEDDMNRLFKIIIERWFS